MSMMIPGPELRTMTGEAGVSFEKAVRGVGVIILVGGLALAGAVLREAWHLYSDDGAIRARAESIDQATHIDRIGSVLLTDSRAYLREANRTPVPAAGRPTHRTAKPIAAPRAVPEAGSGSAALPPASDPDVGSDVLPPEPALPAASGSAGSGAAVELPADPPSAAATAPIPAAAPPVTDVPVDWKPSYFIAWMLTLLLLFLIVHIAYEAMTRGGDLAMGGSRDQRTAKALANELVLALRAQTTDRQTLAEVARAALAELHVDAGKGKKA